MIVYDLVMLFDYTYMNSSTNKRNKVVVILTILFALSFLVNLFTN